MHKEHEDEILILAVKQEENEMKAAGYAAGDPFTGRGATVTLDQQQLAYLHDFLGRAYGTAAALLAVHDDTGISLDDWSPVREFVEFLVGDEIRPNGV